MYLRFADDDDSDSMKSYSGGDYSSEMFRNLVINDLKEEMTEEDCTLKDKLPVENTVLKKVVSFEGSQPREGGDCAVEKESAVVHRSKSVIIRGTSQAKLVKYENIIVVKLSYVLRAILCFIG